MRIQPSRLIEDITGTCKGSQVTLYRWGDQVFARALVVPWDPRTPDQVEVRTRTHDGSRQWGQLSEEVREAWKRWAAQCGGTNRKTGRPARQTGYTAFVSAATHRARIGLPFPHEVPVPLPPPELIACEEIGGGGDPSTFVFRVEQAPAPAGTGVVMPEVVVSVRITPPSPGTGHAQETNNLRLIAGQTAASARLLPPDAVSLVEFQNARFAVAPGQRFGFEITPIRVADGVAGRPVWKEGVRN